MSATEGSGSSENAQILSLKKEEWSPSRVIPGLDLSHRFALIRVEGADAEAFLQGQLTQDMAIVARGESLRAAHCTPKGRVTAVFDVAYKEGAFLLIVPTDRAEAAMSRLKKYVLRSRVTLSLDLDAALIKVWGEVDLPTCPPEACIYQGVNFRIYCFGKDAWSRDSRFFDGFPSLSLAEARLNEFRVQSVYITPATEEAFIPQMLNLDETGGVSFKKGCYTGQEIVARTHYLGRVKRRMSLFTYTGHGLQPGAKVESAEWGPLTIVDVIVLEAGGGVFLAVSSSPEDA